MRIRHFAVAVGLVLVTLPASAQFASDFDRREALRHYRDGQELLSAEQFEKAAEAFQRAIDKDRLLTLAHYGLGQANMALKRHASAIIAFTNCRQAFQTLHGLQERDRVAVERARDDEIRELKDSLRRVQQGSVKTTRLMADRIENRIQELQRQRTSNSGGFIPPPEVSLALGSAYFRNGSLDNAEREWNTAVQVNSKMGEAHNNLAVLYMMRGRKAEAEAAVKAAERAGFRVNPNLKTDIRNMSGQ
jgi:tetratricopeptide (TPR) repeat protein